MHRKIRSDTAKQDSENIPHQNGSAVFLESHTISGCVHCQAVSKLIFPNECVDAAGDNGKDNESSKSGGGFAVSFTCDVDIVCHFVNKIIRIDTAGKNSK